MLPLRQGDVILIPIENDKPAQRMAIALRTRTNKIVLAEAETTGHSHRFERVKGVMRGKPTDIGGAVLYLAESSTLIHEEHAPIEVAAGAYKILIQKEYDPTKDRSYVVD